MLNIFYYVFFWPSLCLLWRIVCLDHFLMGLFVFRNWSVKGDNVKIHVHIPFFFFFFLGLHPRHMEVPRLEVEQELQLLAYTTATAIPDLSCICNLNHSSWQCQIPNLLSEGGIEPTSSGMVVRFVSTAPQWELWDFYLLLNDWYWLKSPNLSIGFGKPSHIFYFRCLNLFIYKYRFWKKNLQSLQWSKFRNWKRTGRVM